jgi:Zn-dependent alcohol dehydrogenase
MRVVVHAGGRRQQRAHVQSLACYREGNPNIDDLITDRLALERINEDVDLMISAGSIGPVAPW